MSETGSGRIPPVVGQLKADLLDYALAMPEAYLDHPWGENVAKVNKKIFVFLGSPDSDTGYLMGVKLPESASGALLHDFAEPSGYGLGKSGWVSLRYDKSELPPVEVLEDWIDESYRAVAPRRLVTVLDSQWSGDQKA